MENKIKQHLKALFWCLWIAGAFYVAVEFFIDWSFWFYYGVFLVGWAPLFYFVNYYFEDHDK